MDEVHRHRVCAVPCGACSNCIWLHLWSDQPSRCKFNKQQTVSLDHGLNWIWTTSFFFFFSLQQLQQQQRRLESFLLLFSGPSACFVIFIFLRHARKEDARPPLSALLVVVYPLEWQCSLIIRCNARPPVSSPYQTFENKQWLDQPRAGMSCLKMSCLLSSVGGVSLGVRFKLQVKWHKDVSLNWMLVFR